MNRGTFLRRMKDLWIENNEIETPLTIEDLLDDSATLGLEGASEIYLAMVSETRRQFDKLQDVG